MIMPVVEQKLFRTDAVLTLYTGTMLAEKGFNALHELTEYALGHPVFTHEFASEDMWRTAKGLLEKQHPILGALDTSTLNSGTFLEWRKNAVAQIGADEMLIKRGYLERTESPLQTAIKHFMK